MKRYVISGSYVLDRKIKSKHKILIAKTRLQLGSWKTTDQPHVVFRGRKGLEILFTK